MTPTGTPKQQALETIGRLPTDATYEDAMERLYFLPQVERGWQAADRGDVVSHEEARRRLLGE